MLQFAYGSYTGREALRDSALTLSNACRRRTTVTCAAGTTRADARSAFESQALLQLATEYCAAKRCAECPSGGAS
ncbi:MAG: hypothetical protein ACLRMJ_07375 [Alistipes finegoldii]